MLLDLLRRPNNPVPDLPVLLLVLVFSDSEELVLARRSLEKKPLFLSGEDELSGWVSFVSVVVLRDLLRRGISWGCGESFPIDYTFMCTKSGDYDVMNALAMPFGRWG